MEIFLKDLKSAYKYIIKTLKYRLGLKILASALMVLYFAINIYGIQNFTIMLGAKTIHNINVWGKLYQVTSYFLGSFGIFCCVLASFVVKTISDTIMTIVITDTLRYVQKNLFKLLQDTEMSFYVQHSSNGISDLINRHISALEGLIHSIFIELIPGVIFLSGIWIFLDVKISLILYFFLFLYLLSMFLMFPFIRQKTAEQAEFSYRKAQYLVEMIESVFVTKILNTNKFTYNRISEQLDQETARKRITFFFQRSLPSSLYTIGIMIVSPLTLFLLRDLNNQVVIYNTFAKVMVLIGMRVGTTGGIYKDFAEIAKSCATLLHLSIKDDVSNIKISKIEKIEIKNLTYRLNGQLILDNLSCTVDVMDRLLIVGQSGVGKSCLIKMLVKIIRVDNGHIFINGHDINHISDRNLYDLIGYIEQNTVVLNDSIRSNIQMGQNIYGDLSKLSDKDRDDKILKGVKMVKFDKKVAEVGLDYVIAPNGVNLSPGQRKRLSILRFLLKDKPPYVWMLDEVTTGLSSDMSLYILSVMLKMESILIAISHDTNWNQYFNKILFLKGEGKYVIDTHQNLYENDLDYQKFFKISFN